MAIETKQVTIGNTTYWITPFTAKKGLAMLKRVLKLVGPSLDNLEKKDEIGMATIISGIISRFDEEPVDLLIQDLVKDVTIDGRAPIIFDTQFQANYGELFTLVKEVLTINYASVFTVGGLDLLGEQSQ